MERHITIIVLDIILIALLIGVFLYVYLNKDTAKALMTDACRVCENKTGGICIQKPKFIHESNETMNIPDYSHLFDNISR